MINELANKIVDSVFDILIIIGADLCILDCNNSIADLGYEKSELIGQPVTDLTVDNAGLRKAIPELVASAKAGKRELRRLECIRKDGSRLWMDIGASEVETTEAADYLIVFHDVDERHRTRQALEEQKRTLEAMKTQLEQANKQLEQRQAVTEAALLEEQKFRLTSQKTGFQKSFVTYLVILIGVSLLLPYIVLVGGVDEKITSATGNLSLLLIQALTGVSGFIFGQRSGKQEGTGKDE